MQRLVALSNNLLAQVKVRSRAKARIRPNAWTRIKIQPGAWAQAKAWTTSTAWSTTMHIELIYFLPNKILSLILEPILPLMQSAEKFMQSLNFLIKDKFILYSMEKPCLSERKVNAWQLLMKLGWRIRSQNREVQSIHLKLVFSLISKIEDEFSLTRGNLM